MSCFCLHCFNIPVKVLFKTDFSICLFVLNKNKKFVAFDTFFSQLGSSKCKQTIGLEFCLHKKKTVSSVSHLWLDDWQSSFGWLLEMPH